MGRSRTRGNRNSPEHVSAEASVDRSADNAPEHAGLTARRSPKPRRPRAKRLAPTQEADAVKSDNPTPKKEQAAEKPHTWKDDLADVQKAAFWLWLCIIWLPGLSLSALSGNEVPGMVWRAIESGSMSPAEALAVWKVLVLTAPFTTAVALVGVAILRGWFDGELFGAVYFASFVLMMTTALSKTLSLGAPVQLEEVSPVNLPPFSWMIDLTVSYYKVYTLGMLCSSLAIGSFLSWVWARKIMPRLERLRLSPTSN